VNKILAISNQVFIAGKMQNVVKIMTYNEGWLNKNYYNPLVKNNKFEYEF
jgi:hypothetical protein